jgi:geranylgeranylglycerol-phosphate geranylgeranyltransferase
MLYVGLVGLAGAWLAGRSVDAPRLAIAWLVPTLGWIGGHYGGDYFDRDLDATAKPHRPIPSGRLPASVALAAMIVLVSGAGLLALWANPRTIVLVAAATAAGIGYSKVFKAEGLSGNLIRGSLTAFVVLFGAMMATRYPPWWTLPVAAVFLLHDSQSNLVGAMRDIDGDRAAGYETFPVHRGIRAALRAVVSMTVLWVAVAVAAAFIQPAGADLVTYFALLAVSVSLAGLAITVLVRAAEPMPPAVALRAHSLLVVERVILAGAFIGLAAGPLPAAIATVPCVLITVTLQTRMRANYEFGRPARAAAAGRPDGPSDLTLEDIRS